MRDARRILFCCLLPVTLTAGCTTFWDEVTSRDFKFKNLYYTPPPMEVLRDSDDGWARANALAALTEPLQSGGSQKEQDLAVEILTKAATVEPHPLVRIAAIKSLGRFKDPRAAQVLCTVTEQNLTFPTSDSNNLIRQEAFKALAETGQPLAVRRLIDEAKEPPNTDSKADQQEVLDRRLTAIRGLGRYNYPEAKETLLVLLEKDKDVAVKKRAYESLKSATGKDLPPNPEVWAHYLHPEDRPAEAVAQQPNTFWDYVTWPIRLVRGQ